MVAPLTTVRSKVLAVPQPVLIFLCKARCSCSRRPTKWLVLDLHRAPRMRQPSLEEPGSEHLYLTCHTAHYHDGDSCKTRRPPGGGGARL